MLSSAVLNVFAVALVTFAFHQLLKEPEDISVTGVNLTGNSTGPLVSIGGLLADQIEVGQTLAQSCWLASFIMWVSVRVLLWGDPSFRDKMMTHRQRTASNLSEGLLEVRTEDGHWDGDTASQPSQLSDEERRKSYEAWQSLMLSSLLLGFLTSCATGALMMRMPYTSHLCGQDSWWPNLPVLFMFVGSGGGALWNAWRVCHGGKCALIARSNPETGEMHAQCKPSRLTSYATIIIEVMGCVFFTSFVCHLYTTDLCSLQPEEITSLAKDTFAPNVKAFLCVLGGAQARVLRDLVNFMEGYLRRCGGCMEFLSCFITMVCHFGVLAGVAAFGWFELQLINAWTDPQMVGA